MRPRGTSLPVSSLIKDPGLAWDAAEAYEQLTGRWSAAVAHALLDEVSMPRGVSSSGRRLRGRELERRGDR
jgi:hypothetical protein